MFSFKESKRVVNIAAIEEYFRARKVFQPYRLVMPHGKVGEYGGKWGPHGHAAVNLVIERTKLVTS